jgi:hypothetical protein
MYIFHLPMPATILLSIKTERLKGLRGGASWLFPLYLRSLSSFHSNLVRNLQGSSCRCSADFLEVTKAIVLVPLHILTLVLKILPFSTSGLFFADVPSNSLLSFSLSISKYIRTSKLLLQL